MSKRLKVYTIKRSEWLRGKGSDVSCLWSQSMRKGCCVGLAVIQDGFKKTWIERLKTGRSRVTSVESLFFRVRAGKSVSAKMEDKFNQLMIDSPVINADEKDLNRLYVINDSEHRTDREREMALNKCAKELGFRFKFVD